jgi:hypothetical protein
MSTQIKITNGPLASASGGTAELPQWIRLPAPGACEPRTGLKRAVLTRLAVTGKVKSISLKEPGAKRGCRLINLPSLLEYLSAVELEQGAEFGEVQP